MKKRVLVTGANGQLGQTIKELYTENDLELDFVFVSKSDLDITNKDLVSKYFRENHFDYCINCAAYTNVEQAEKKPEPAFLVNAEGVKNLALECKKHSTILIHISTDYVFDGEKTSPYTVNDKTNPINEYGKSKLKGEQYIQEVLQQFFIVRTSWLYSKKHGKNFYKTIIEKSKTVKELTITDEQIGRPTNTENLSKSLIELIVNNNENFGIYHYCDNKTMTWFDFAESILQERNLKDKINLVKGSNYRTFAKRPKYSVLKNKLY